MGVRIYRRSRPVLGSAAAAFFSLAAACGGGGGTTGGGNTSTDPFVAQAKVVADKAIKPVTSWDGPTSGAKAQQGKFIVYVSESQQNGGASGVGAGVQEAAAALGWKFKLIDGQGTVQGQTAAMNQAIALKPDGIDRKSTRLNSSHEWISYAVFCLKK